MRKAITSIVLGIGLAVTATLGLTGCGSSSKPCPLYVINCGQPTPPCILFTACAGTGAGAGGGAAG